MCRSLPTCSVLLTLALTTRAFPADLPSPAMTTLTSQFRDYCLGTTSNHGERLLDDVDLPKTSPTEVQHLIATLQPDGSWPDIDYKNPDRSAWPAFAHLSRLARAGYVFAREGVLALIDPRPLPMPAWRSRAIRPRCCRCCNC